MNNKITSLIWPALLLLCLSACATPPEIAVSAVPAGTTTLQYRYDNQRFRGTNLGFTDDVKAKLRDTEINIVDLTLAIQNQLRRQNLLDTEAPQLIAVTIDELQISPLYETAFFAFRTEEDRIAGKVEIIDDAQETLADFDVAVTTDPKEAIEGGRQGRLQQLYQMFAERVVTVIMAEESR